MNELKEVKPRKKIKQIIYSKRLCEWGLHQGEMRRGKEGLELRNAMELKAGLKD